MSKTAVSLSLAGAAIAAAVIALPAQAQFSKPEDAIRYRQSGYVIMGHNMGKIFAQLRSDKPDLAVIQRAAEVTQFVFALPGEGYIPGSERGGNPPTRAKAEIFQRPNPRLVEVATATRNELAKLNEVAKGGDIAAIRTQFQATARACDSCHDDFRNK